MDERTAQAQLPPEERRELLRAFADRMRRKITAGIREVLVKNPAVFDPRTYFKPAYALMQKVCEDRFEQFGSAGQAAKIKPVGLSTMVQFYL